MKIEWKDRYNLGLTRDVLRVVVVEVGQVDERLEERDENSWIGVGGKVAY